MEPPESTVSPPGWQHPAVVAVVTVLVVTTIVAAIAFGTSNGSGDRSAGPSPALDPPPPERVQPDDPVPTPPARPVAPPPPVLRIEIDRPDRGELVTVAQQYLDAWSHRETEALRALSWSGCASAGAELETELDARLGAPSAATYGFERAIVISENLAVVDLVEAVGSPRERLVFVHESGAWSSGLCADPSGDLGRLVDLPDDIVAVAGLDYVGEDLAMQNLQRLDLAHARFDAADLSRASLLGSVVEGATFVGADLTEVWAPDLDAGDEGVDFTDAIVAKGVFFDADLDGADFTGVDARSADFTGASLVGVSFSGANLDGAFIDGRAAGTVGDWTDAICPDGETADPLSGCLEHLNPFG